MGTTVEIVKILWDNCTLQARWAGDVRAHIELSRATQMPQKKLVELHFDFCEHSLGWTLCLASFWGGCGSRLGARSEGWI